MIKVTFDLSDPLGHGLDMNYMAGALARDGIPTRKIIADLRPGKSMRCTVILMDHGQTLDARKVIQKEYWWGKFVD